MVVVPELVCVPLAAAVDVADPDPAVVDVVPLETVGVLLAPDAVVVVLAPEVAAVVDVPELV